jgi:hypothetical protein
VPSDLRRVQLNQFSRKENTGDHTRYVGRLFLTRIIVLFGRRDGKRVLVFYPFKQADGCRAILFGCVDLWGLILRRIKEANCVLYVHLGGIWCSWVSCASLAIQFLANMPALPCVILNVMVAAYIVCLMYSVGRIDRPKADEPKGFNYNLFTSGNKARMKQLLSRCKDELTSKMLVTGIDSEVRRC